MRFHGLVLLYLSLSLSGCGTRAPSSSDTTSVEIDQTAIENQNKVGFCWAYATTAWIESAHKMATGGQVNLSEESLGFYRMAYGMRELTQAKSAEELIPLLQGTSEGNWLSSDITESSYDALTLVKTYGVVPESVWTYKFFDDDSAQRMDKALKSGLLALVVKKALQGKKPKTITVDEIIRHVMTVPGAYPSAPPTAFSYEGTAYTAQSFLADRLGFRPDDYEAVTTTAFGGEQAVIAATKLALARGLAVPLAYPVSFARLQGDTFTGRQVDGVEEGAFPVDGGHAVLITDFVNHGGVEGAVSREALSAELVRAPADLDYLVIKNSWGVNATTNESGETVPGSATGYYKIDQDYLKLSADAVVVNQVPRLLSVIVPRDIAADPFGAAVAIDERVVANQ